MALPGFTGTIAHQSKGNIAFPKGSSIISCNSFKGKKDKRSRITQKNGGLEPLAFFYYILNGYDIPE